MLRNFKESSRVIKKLEELSNKELLEVSKAMYPHVQEDNISFGDSDHFSITEQMDGIDCYVGINENEEIIVEAEDYEDLDDVSQIVKRNPHIIGALDELYEKVGPVKIECAMFPNFNHDGDENGNVVYSVLPYDKKKMGTQGAFLLGDVKTWSPSEKNYIVAEESVASIVKSKLEESDNSKWRIYNEKNVRMYGEGKIELSKFSSIFEDEMKYENTLKVFNNPENETNRNILEKATERLRKSFEGCLRGIVNNSNSSFGNIKNKSSVKGAKMVVPTEEKTYIIEISNPNYEKLREKVFEKREKFNEMKNTSTVDLYNEVFGMNFKNIDHFNERLERQINNFRSNHVGESRINHFLKEFATDNKNPDVSYTGEETKANAIKFIKKLERLIDEFVDAKQDFESDVDSKRKLDRMIDKFKKEIQLLKKLISIRKYSGDELAVYLLKAVLAPKLIGKVENLREKLDDKGNVISRAKFPEPVVLMLTKAQPWSKMHDSMLREAKKRMHECGAKKIYLGVTGEGFEDFDPDNLTEGTVDITTQKSEPLSTSTRVDLLKEVYKDDPLIEICQETMKTDTITDILEKVFYKENKKVVGVVCAENVMTNESEKWNKGIDESQWRANYCHELPIDKVRVLGVTERGLSEAQSRDIVLSSDWENWKDAVVPEWVNESALKKYESIYNLMYEKFRKCEDYDYRNNVKNIFWGNK